MAFNALFVAHAPDADPEKHGYLIETPKYRLFVRVVQNQVQAIQVCQDLVKREGVHAIILCPGFTHIEIAELAKAVGENVGIFVARGDPPSNRIVAKVMEKEGWFSREE
ncbi:MAG: DUF6506 family protein [Anaerolineae bacterium]|nr:DUF6506 family protein [Anaerolineae bacterium]MDW8101386.1 DUF6506 family protein [Anaerolineae bacterium]